MEIPRILELAWERAYPGREAAERNAVLRELTEPMQRENEALTRSANRTGGCRIAAGGHAGAAVENRGTFDRPRAGALIAAPCLCRPDSSRPALGLVTKASSG